MLGSWWIRPVQGLVIVGVVYDYHFVAEGAVTGAVSLRRGRQCPFARACCSVWFWGSSDLMYHIDDICVRYPSVTSPEIIQGIADLQLF